MDDKVTSKSELLQQLKIDRSTASGTQGVSKGVVVLIALTGLLVGWFIGDWKSAEPVLDVIQNSNALNALNTSKTEISQEPDLTHAPTKVPASVAILNASGYITARRMATVSAETMGLITEVNVEEGMIVKEGQILARLDDAIARVNLDFSKAQLHSLIVRHPSIQANYDEALSNQQRVRDNDYSSEADITRVDSEVKRQKAYLASSQADIRVAELEVQRQQERLNDHIIRAPFSGVVTVKNAQPGEIVAPSSAGGGFTRTGICTIVDMESLEVEVDINEAFIGRVFADQQVVVNLDAYPDWKLPAAVIAIIPTADRAKATVKVRIKILMNDPKILPDMGVKVAFLEMSTETFDH